MQCKSLVKSHDSRDLENAWRMIICATLKSYHYTYYILYKFGGTAAHYRLNYCTESHLNKRRRTAGNFLRAMPLEGRYLTPTRFWTVSHNLKGAFSFYLFFYFRKILYSGFYTYAWNTRTIIKCFNWNWRKKTWILAAWKSHAVKKLIGILLQEIFFIAMLIL